MKTLLLSSLMLCPSVAPAATLVGLWEFNNSGNLGQATVGSDATLFGTTSSTTGVTGSDGAINIATGIASYITVGNPIAANGASGTPTRTNQFTIVLDFMIPDFDDGGADNGQFTGLFDFDNGGGDGDYFIRKQANAAELGLGATNTWSYVGAGATTANNGAAGTVRENIWYRLVLTANNGVAGESSVFLNGTLIGDHATGTIDNARRSLSTSTALRVFWDNTAGENSRALVSNLALYEGRMTDAEAIVLGTAGTQIVVPGNALPAMVVADAGTSPVAPNVSANYTFSATDTEGDPVQFEVDWGDGQIETWSASQAVASPYVVAHTYATPGSYVIRARVRDSEDDAPSFTTIQTISVVGKGLTWTGALDTEWSIASLTAPKNWVLTGDPITTADFANGDDVIIDDSATATTIAINGADVSPFTVAINNPTKNFTVSGTHGIAGVTGLEKSGAGGVILSNPNSFQGNTTITDGTITLNHELALANSVVNTAFPDGNLVFGTVTQATLGGLGGDGDIALKNTSDEAVALTLGKNGVTSTHAGQLSGAGSLIKVGTGTQVLNFTNLFTGGTALNAGNLRMATVDALGTGDIVHAGGSLTFSFGAGTVANNITLAPTAYQTFVVRGGGNTAPTAGAEVNLAGKISGGTAGLLYRLVDSGTGLNHNNVLILSNATNDFEGNIELWRGFLAFTSNAALGNIENDIRIECNNGNGGLRFDADGITLGAERTITLPTSNNQEAFTVPSGTGTIAGPIVGAGAMIKRGAGELVLASANNTFTGNMNVAAGKLTINGPIATSANPVTVTVTGTLGGTGPINRVVTVNGSIAPGSSIGNMEITGNTTISGSYLCEIDGATSDALAVTGNLTLGAASSLDVAELSAATSFPYVIATYTGTLTGTFNTVTAGYEVDYGTVGQIKLTQGTPFDSWAALKGLDGTPGKENGFTDDPDQDGIDNGLEFVLNGDPLSGSSPVLPTGLSVGSDFIFTFTRRDDSEFLNPVVEFDTDLVAPWTTAVDPGNATISVSENGADPDTVTVTIPKNGNTEMFARLKVVQP
jgi:autotransporter-associated beta strand protein